MPENINQPESRAYDIVLSFLKQQIKGGKLSLGDKLPSERTLMTQLDLSRNSVREALRQLENMGFVRSIHGQGSFLVNHAGQGFSSIFSMLLLLHQTDKLEFLALRQCLENAAFIQAVQSPSLESIASLEQALSSMEQAKDQRQMEQAEVCFHQSLITAGKNQLFSMIMDALSSLGDMYRKEILSHLDPAVCGPLLQTHRDLVQALKDGNEADGCTALQRHFELIGYSPSPTN
ncbi:MAG: FadR/GntR family transcriptional regulator [Clostridium sp.]